MAEWLTLASQQCGPDSIKAQCDMRVNFVDSRMLARLFPVFSGLPTSKKKPTSSNSNSTRIKDTH